MAEALQNSSEDAINRKPSLWRRAAAFYIDLLIAQCAILIAFWLLKVQFGTWPVAIAFTLIEYAALAHFGRLTPGERLLGIQTEIIETPRGPKRTKLVEPQFIMKRSVPLIILGTIESWDASRIVVSLIRNETPRYILANEVYTGTMGVGLLFFHLFLACFIVYSVLRLKIWGGISLLIYQALYTANNVWSFPRAVEIAEEALVNKSAGNLESSPFLPEHAALVVVGSSIVYLIAVVVVTMCERNKFRSRPMIGERHAA